MKLLRYGPSGAEKPAMLDANGDIRCLSAVVRDIDGYALNDATLDMLRRIDAEPLPAARAQRIQPILGFRLFD